MTNNALKNIFPMPNNPAAATAAPTIAESPNPNPNNTATSIDTEPGVFDERMRILAAYSRLFGDMPSQIGWYLTELIEDGMEIDVIINAIEETAWARKPSPRYMRCILDRYRKEEIFTMTDLRMDNRDYRLLKEEHHEGEWWYR